MNKPKTDPVTMICREHEVCGCIVCMTDDYFHWIDEQNDIARARKARYRANMDERRTLTVHEQFDLGGES